MLQGEELDYSCKCGGQGIWEIFHVTPKIWGWHETWSHALNITSTWNIKVNIKKGKCALKYKPTEEVPDKMAYCPNHFNVLQAKQPMHFRAKTVPLHRGLGSVRNEIYDQAFLINLWGFWLLNQSVASCTSIIASNNINLNQHLLDVSFSENKLWTPYQYFLTEIWASDTVFPVIKC